MSFGSSKPPPPPPTQTTTRQVPEYAPEQREYVTDIFGKAQELYEQRSAEGFQPFPGPQLAPFAAQEQEAFSGIESLARGPGAAPAFEVARTAALGAAAPVTAAEIQQGMNPYQQAVTDIAKREAVRQFQRGPQAQLRTGAVESGGLRGARRFIEEAEGQRNLQQQLSDIQTLGGQQAFQQSMAEAAAARGRLANLATQMPSIGTGAYQQQMAQLGQLGGVGEAQRAREQAAIDLAQGQFQQELMFPEETLATYLRFITNAPSPSGFQRDVVAPGVPGPSALTQLAGGLAGGATLGKAVGLFNRGGAVPPALGRQAGLSGIVRRAGGGQIVRMQDGGKPRANFFRTGFRDPNAPDTRSEFTRKLEAGEFTPEGVPYDGFGARRRKEERVEELVPQLIEANILGRSPNLEYLFGTPESYEEALAEQEAYKKFIDERPTEFPEAFEDQYGETTKPEDMIAAASFGVEEKSATEQKPAAEKPAGKAASFRVLPPAEPKPTETKSAFMSGLDNLSTGDLLKLSGAFFQAGSQGSTGNPFTDLTQFLGSAGVTAGDVINKAEKRKLAAADKKFLRGLKEREVKAVEDKGKAALMAAGKDKGEFKTPTTKDIDFTKAILQDGPYEKVSDAAVRQIAQIQKKYDKYSPQEIAAMLEASGALVIDDTGFWSFIGGGTPTLQTAGE
tara:strand:+ start:1326 stop:3356 length:2031 start_codon:yes stop_codon:yes gene_type:complete